jgi:transcription elongation GreA/GreB family factor
MHGEPLYFLQEDLEHLEQAIEEVRQHIRRAKHEAAESVEQSSESWHDNFTFEESQRQLRMLLNHLGGLSKQRERAVLVEIPTRPERVEIGTRVIFTGLGDAAETMILGSANVGPHMSALGAISYLSPVGSLLLGGVVGETRARTISGRSVTLEIVSIDVPDELLCRREGPQNA